MGINDQGDVAGTGRRESDDGEILHVAFARIEDHMVLIDPLLGQLETTALDINDVGQVVGVSHTREEGSDAASFTACLWQHGVTHDLNALVAAEFEAHIRKAIATNDSGQIVAQVTGAFVLLTPVGRPPGDVDADCRTGSSDLQLVVEHWGHRESLADVNQSGIVDVDDILLVLLNWTG